VNIMRGNLLEAETCLNRVRVLPRPTEIGDLARMAQPFAMLDHDQEVYDLLQPLLSTLEQPEELDTDVLEDAVILGAVAAIHLGKRAEAQRMLDLIRGDTDNLLVERTSLVLANDEEGPRPGGRFFYLDPVSLYSESVNRYRLLLENLTEPPTPEYIAEAAPLFRDHGDQILEVLTYQVWSTENPELVVALLAQAITAQVPGVVELVKHLAFGKVCTETQRLIIASSLVIVGVLDRAEPVTIWLKGQPYTDNLSRLAQRFQELEGLARG
jgi:hypothetical protein